MKARGGNILEGQYGKEMHVGPREMHEGKELVANKPDSAGARARTSGRARKANTLHKDFLMG
jgi:hypothetical protein